jgi:hypothetical protein
MTQVNFRATESGDGKFEWEGKMIYLDGDADTTSKALPFGYNEVQWGEEYVFEMTAPAHDDAGNIYEVVWHFWDVKGQDDRQLDEFDYDDVYDVVLVEEAPDPDEKPSPYQVAYDALTDYVPSHKTPHLDALAEAGLLDQLTTEQVVAVVRIAQRAYQAGRASADAEVVDPGAAVWVAGTGLLEKQPSGVWVVAK